MLEVPQQPGRTLTSTHQAARTRHEVLPLTRRRARFLAVFSAISPHFRPGRHKLTAGDYRSETTDRFVTWNAVTGVPVV